MILMCPYEWMRTVVLYIVCTWIYILDIPWWLHLLCGRERKLVHIYSSGERKWAFTTGYRSPSGQQHLLLCGFKCDAPRHIRMTPRPSRQHALHPYFPFQWTTGSLQRRPGVNNLDGGCFWLLALGVPPCSSCFAENIRRSEDRYPSCKVFCAARQTDIKEHMQRCIHLNLNLLFSLDTGQQEEMFLECETWQQTSSIALVFERTIKFSLDRVHMQSVPVCILGFRHVIWRHITDCTAAILWPVAPLYEDVLMSHSKHSQEAASPGELNKQRAKETAQITGPLWKKYISLTSFVELLFSAAEPHTDCLRYL